VNSDSDQLNLLVESLKGKTFHEVSSVPYLTTIGRGVWKEKDRFRWSRRWSWCPRCRR
jgi:hypothetical protein